MKVFCLHVCVNYICVVVVTVTVAVVKEDRPHLMNKYEKLLNYKYDSC